jgi:hypothetical protein
MADNPYAAYATPPQANPYAAFAEGVAVNPYAAVEPDTSLTQNVKVATRAALPYPTAAAMGALAGAPFGGPVGAAAGAGLATLGLGIGDIGTAGYNVLANYLGGRRVALPSETIQELYGRAGIGAEPQTPEQRMLASAVGGAVGAGGTARAVNTLAPMAQSPVTRNVLTELGRQPTLQMATGAGAATAPTALQEYGDVNDPTALTISSIVGGVLSGKAAAGAGNVGRTVRGTLRSIDTPSTAELKTQAQSAYRRADEAGVIYRPEKFDEFSMSLRNSLEKEGFDKALHPNVATALDRVSTLTDTGIPGVLKPVSFQDMDMLRKIAKSARSSENADERRLGLMLTNKLNDFATKPPANAVFTGDVKEAAGALADARAAWSKMSKSGEIEDAIERARLSPQAASGKVDEAIRTQFANLAKEINKGWHPGFTEAEVAVINQIAKNKTQKFGLSALSLLEPNMSVSGIARTGAQIAAGTAAAGPYGAALAIPSMAVGYGARVGRNALADLYTSNLAAGVRRGDVTAPLEANRMLMLSPLSQQMLIQSQQGQ